MKLPADEKMLQAIDDPSRSYVDFFPLGQPLKSLYAVHALHEYLGLQRSKFTPGLNEQDQKENGHSFTLRQNGLMRAMALVVAALCDPQVGAQCPNQERQIELGSALVQFFVSLLAGMCCALINDCYVVDAEFDGPDPEIPASAAKFLDGVLLDRLLSILSVATASHTSIGATTHVPCCLQSILESCSMSSVFMSAFCTHPQVPRLLEDLLLNDERVAVRQNTALLIRQKTCLVQESGRYEKQCVTAVTNLPLTVTFFRSPQEVDSTTAKFRDFLWPLVSRLVRPAIAKPEHSAEVLDICFLMLRTLQEARSEITNLQRLSDDWFDLLLSYTTTEVS